ncbi:tyrosine--tRNA ligase [Mycoplasma nasistruthionis]|uniref:Tyrosine--tRNA ligase n=1 Tax=Mycoplasma nasistruthionis TaxID=353852 RepID=A0A5B7XVX3_9MOLU|nr:tyrosine--tRNA ligase [Mycoplasma nasistruthionis]QCZ36720.1 tyrosine--tRNA ligase [Mycoplasma nasistruthionis]
MFEERGILKAISNEQKLNNIGPNDAIYCGFDPTAKSLHLGNYIQIINLLRLKYAGYKVYALVGGATGMIGDPSFKDAERQLLDSKTLELNKSKIKAQLEKFGIEVIDNYDFYKNMNFLEFLRDAGKLVNVAYMLTKDSVTARIQNGLSFTEFSYQLIQGWDFLTLYKEKNVKVQFGGSDQWGNITTGLDMINTVFGNDHKAVAITANLLTDINGNKFGKSTGGGSLWLDPEMTKPYQLYQFLLNQPDSEVEKLLKWLSHLSVENIEQIIQQHQAVPQIRLGQRALAFAVVNDIHGKDAARKAGLISALLFNKDIDLQAIPTADISDIFDDVPNIELKANSPLIDQLIELKVIQSKREAREFIQANAIKFNLENVDNIDFVVNSQVWQNQYALIHVGKKKIYLAKISK